MADEAVKKEKKAKKDSKKKQGFFQGVKAEFKKVVWTDKKTLGKQTVAVIVISAIMVVMITLVDLGALQLVETICK